MNNKEQIEEQELILAKERFQWEKTINEERMKLEKDKLAYDNRFINKHLGVILTTMISIATIIVSITQIGVALVSKQTELNRQEAQKEAELTRLDAQKQKELDLNARNQERQWKLDIAKFISDNKDKIFSNNAIEQKRMSDLILVTFPPEITNVLFQNLENTTSGNDKALWKESQQKAIKLILPRVYIQIVNEDQREDARAAQNLLENRQLIVPGIQKVNSTSANTELRYFRKSEEQEAKQIAESLKNFNVQTIYIPGNEDSTAMRPRHYELWFAKKS